MDEESSQTNGITNQTKNGIKGNRISPNTVTAINTISHSLLHEFQIFWNNFSVYVDKNRYGRYVGLKKSRKSILRNISGCFKSGELTAIMGPSGCGKSTLLQCIAGRWRDGKQGDIYFSGERSRTNLTFIPQHDNYFDVLTVEETLLFASRLQTATLVSSDYYEAIKKIAQEQPQHRLEIRRYTISDANYHRLTCGHILKLLGLEDLNDVRVGKLSGGQKKRLSIAQELLSKPDILILDEPTSGLDSSASLHCVELLQSLAHSKPSMSVIITIHQPNMRTFELFDRMYVLSSGGQCIFNGPPDGLIGHLEKNGYPCPNFQNPGDFLLEIASVELGREAINKMLECPFPGQAIQATPYMKKDLRSATFRAKYPYFQHFLILLHRSLLLISRDPLLAAIRYGLHVGMALFLGWIYGPHIGRYAGCPPELGGSFDAHVFKNASEKAVEETKGLLDNFASLFFHLMMLMFGSLTPMLVTFPMEVSTFLKEKYNGWYSTGPYFMSKTLADLPFQIMATFSYTSITYVMNGQIRELWRYEAYLLVGILVSLIGQSHGLIVGAFFVHQMTAAVFLGPLTSLPLLLFSGFLVKIETMPAILRPLTSLSYIRYGFEGVLVSLYGYNRCGLNASEKIAQLKGTFKSWMNKMLIIATQTINEDDDEQEMREDVDNVHQMTDSLTSAIFNSVSGGISNTNSTIKSGVMVIYNLEDSFLERAFIMLLINLIVFRLATYLILKWKARH
ncbi:ATP-binding cassette sub-family G member 1-like [Brevipalpus obovatus]|uniref:ATP-binding cassette sub-family G member 1-like n=1 Tax=Brevipalpus obovatus TaxID=246614 RepID=UPI003D9DEAF3